MATYEDLRLIGTGGFGEVWRCRRESDNAIFAKKKLGPNTDVADVARFIKEVRILQGLDHPNIVRVVGIRLGSAPQFYVMPLYRRTLDSELSSLAGDSDRIDKIFSRILDGVEYAHSQNVLHRDLKPQNVLMNSDTDVVIADFGLGRVFDSASTRMTLTGYGLGTPIYMAPEQIADAKNADHRADVYSLGRMLYELYVGDIAFGVQDVTGLPAGIATIITRCTQRDKARRYQTVADIKSAWRLLHDATARMSAAGEFQRLLAELSATSDSTAGQISAFAAQMSAHMGDPDVAREVLMGLSEESLAALYERAPDEIARAATALMVQIGTQSWSFDYTDKLANRCEILHGIITDAEVRATIDVALIELGVDHNRWHVMKIASQLIERCKDPGEVLELCTKLRDVPSHKLRTISRYVSIGKLDISLREFFDAGAAGESKSD